MLKKYFFIAPDSSIKVWIFSFILLIWSASLFVVALVLFSLVLLLFRKKNMTNISANKNLAMSPCDGILWKRETGSQSLDLKVGIINNYGVRMPFDGEVTSFVAGKKVFFKIGNKKIYSYFCKLELKNEGMGVFKMRIQTRVPGMRPQVWARTGDLGIRGAYLGYLPFGGKVVIDLPEKLKLLTNKDHLLVNAKTMIASKELENV